MPACIICHLDIMENIDVLEMCPNNHPVHSDCLQQWLLHSNSCPLCNTPYSAEVINRYKDFVDKDAKEKEEALKSKIEQETLEKVEKIAKKMVFLKYVEQVEELMDKGQFDLALEKIEPFMSNDLMNFKSKKALFLGGKINYLRGRFDLAINNLFKLVKEDFNYPDAFLYLGKSYEELGLTDKAQWAYERMKK